MSRHIEIRKHFSPQLSKFLASITTASFFTWSGLHKTAHNSLFLRFTGSMNQIKPSLQVAAGLLLLSSPSPRAAGGEKNLQCTPSVWTGLTLHFVFQIPDSPFLPSSIPPGWVKAVPDAVLFLYSNTAASLRVQRLGSELPASNFFQHFIFPPYSPFYLPHPLYSYLNPCWVLRIHGSKRVSWVQVAVLAQASAEFSSYSGNFIFQLQKTEIGKLQSLLIQERCRGGWVLWMSLDTF